MILGFLGFSLYTIFRRLSARFVLSTYYTLALGAVSHTKNPMHYKMHTIIFPRMSFEGSSETNDHFIGSLSQPASSMYWTYTHRDNLSNCLYCNAIFERQTKYPDKKAHQRKIDGCEKEWVKIETKGLSSLGNQAMNMKHTFSYIYEITPHKLN